MSDGNLFHIPRKVASDPMIKKIYNWRIICLRFTVAVRKDYDRCLLLANPKRLENFDRA